MTALAGGRILSIYMQLPSTLFNYKYNTHLWF
jgi:hypothetical protein